MTSTAAVQVISAVDKATEKTSEAKITTGSESQKKEDPQCKASEDMKESPKSTNDETPEVACKESPASEAENKQGATLSAENSGKEELEEKTIDDASPSISTPKEDSNPKEIADESSTKSEVEKSDLKKTDEETTDESTPKEESASTAVAERQTNADEENTKEEKSEEKTSDESAPKEDSTPMVIVDESTALEEEKTEVKKSEEKTEVKKSEEKTEVKKSEEKIPDTPKAKKPVTLKSETPQSSTKKRKNPPSSVTRASPRRSRDSLSATHMTQGQLDLAAKVKEMMVSISKKTKQRPKMLKEELIEFLDEISEYSLDKFLEGDERKVIRKAVHVETEKGLMQWLEAKES